MQLTLHTDYALRALIYLATSEEPLSSVGDFADAYGISKDHLVKVVQRLADMGCVETVRGRNGGVRLAQAPERIRIGEVARRLEPHFALVECLSGKENACCITPACGLTAIMKEARDAFLGVLDGYTLADCLGKKKQLG